MEVLKNSMIKKSSLKPNKNSKKKNSNKNLKQNAMLNDNKNKYLSINPQNSFKGMPLLSQKNNKQTHLSKIKPLNINNKDSLAKNLLIRAISYKKIDKDENKNKKGSKPLANKKVKKDIFEYKAQKIIEDINKDLIINNDMQTIKGKNLSNINNDDIS